MKNSRISRYFKFALITVVFLLTNCFQDQSTNSIEPSNTKTTTENSPLYTLSEPTSEGGLEILSMSITPETVEDGGEAVVTITTNRNEDLSYTWYSDVGYMYGAEGGKANFAAIGCCGDNAEGESKITVKVSDSMGKASQELTVLVYVP